MFLKVVFNLSKRDDVERANADVERGLGFRVYVRKSQFSALFPDAEPRLGFEF